MDNDNSITMENILEKMIKDEKSEELCICMDNYSEDINSDSWVVLSDILKWGESLEDNWP